MSRSERAKGVDGEREVVQLLRSFGLECARTPNSGGLAVRGDITGLAGVHLEVKRHEVLRLPAWLRQAEAEARAGATPIVAFRRNREDWYAALRLADLAQLLAASGEHRRDQGRRQ